MPRLVPPMIAAGTLGETMQPVLDLGRDGLRARPWEAGDRGALVAATADPEIQRWHLVRFDSPDEAGAWITATQTGWRSETVASWAIVDDGPHPVLGRISLYFTDLRDGIGEVTYWVLPEARGRGRAPMAVDGPRWPWTPSARGRSVRPGCTASNWRTPCTTRPRVGSQ